MNIRYTFFLFLLVPASIFAQTIAKPIGCFAGTNGTNPAVLAHPDARGVLLTEKWSNIEPSPGEYDFTILNNRIDAVKAAGLKYSLAIPAGAFGSPDWLIDTQDAAYHNFNYQNQNWRLPLWWDAICNQHLTNLIIELGNQYAADTMLSHVYVSQMTVNGVEGHLNGVDMLAFANDGFTDQKWIAAAKSTVNKFANAFPDKPIVFEIHEIDHDTVIPATIINDLTSNADLCDRLGLGMWWISGKTTYQTDLIDYIHNFQGDKYAQVIGRSDQPERFKDSIYGSVFLQAKELNIRYIEPWPYEFQHHTNDSLFQDFNTWADANFTQMDTCSFFTATTNLEYATNDVVVYPNPTAGVLNFKFDFQYQEYEITILNLNGQELLSAINQPILDISHLPKGIYFVTFNIDEQVVVKKFTKM